MHIDVSRAFFVVIKMQATSLFQATTCIERGTLQEAGSCLAQQPQSMEVHVASEL